MKERGKGGEGGNGRGRKEMGRKGRGPRGGEGRSTCLPPRFDNPGYGPERIINATGFTALFAPFIGILFSILIIAYALIDTSVDFATVQK